MTVRKGERGNVKRGREWKREKERKERRDIKGGGRQRADI